MGERAIKLQVCLNVAQAQRRCSSQLKFIMFKQKPSKRLISSLISTTVLVAGSVCAAFAINAQTYETFSATVFDPPSNVRAAPNGKVLCTITSVKAITVWNDTYGGSEWLATNACGGQGRGYIHRSQINNVRQ